MYLGTPLLPINFTAKAALAEVEKNLKKKSWQEFESTPLELNLVPFFFFNYHYYLEKEESGHAIIKNAYDGILAVDGHAIVAEPEKVEVIKDNMKKLSAQAPKENFKEKWNNIEKKEQDEVLKLKTAHFFGVPKENVVISSPKKVLMPIYKTTITVAEKKYALQFNALDGEIRGLNEIPEREKGYVELTQETLDDLKHPRKWFDYSKGLVVGVKKSSYGKRGDSEKSGATEAAEIKESHRRVNLGIFSSKIVLILIVLLAIMLIFLAIFY